MSQPTNVSLPPWQRAAKREQARTTSTKLEPSPEFFGANQRFFAFKSAEHILSGPAETGKTYTALHKLHGLIRKTPNAQAAIIRKTKTTMYSTVLQTWEKKVLQESNGVRAYGGEKPQWYDYPNGARVYVAGMDDPGKVLSGELDYVYVNQAEELELEDWETLTTRTTGRAGNADFAMLFGDCNPGPDRHWILQREKEGSLNLLHSRHEDNPTLFDQPTGEITAQGKETLSRLDKLTGTRYKRLRKGLWVGAEGAVYEEDYDPTLHLVSSLPTFVKRYRVVDFGFRNPFVCQWWGEDHDGVLYLYREIYMTQRLVEDHARQINRSAAP